MTAIRRRCPAVESRHGTIPTIPDRLHGRSISRPTTRSVITLEISTERRSVRPSRRGNETVRIFATQRRLNPLLREFYGNQARFNVGPLGEEFSLEGASRGPSYRPPRFVAGKIAYEKSRCVPSIAQKWRTSEAYQLRSLESNGIVVRG